MLSDSQIEQFQTLYSKHFGKDISKEDAQKQATNLLRLVELTYKPMTREEYLKLQKNYNL